MFQKAAYCIISDKVIFSSGTEKTCVGSGHLGRASFGEAAHNAYFRN